MLVIVVVQRASYLELILSCFPPLEAFIALSITVKASSEKEGIQVISISGPSEISV